MQIVCEKCFSTTDNDKIACPFCNQSFENTNPENALPYNMLLNDRYTVNRYILSDSEGILYAAIDGFTKKRVIVKEFMPISLCNHRTQGVEVVPIEGKEVLFKTIRMDFQELYNLLQRISETESGLVRVFDVFEKNNTVYGVCEKTKGLSLREYVQTSAHSISYKQAALLLSPLAKSLEALHRLGVVHRGVSPDTIFLTDNGIAILGGFATLGVRTLGSELVHTLYDGYAAPEQYSVAEFDGNYTDIYALGAVFYFVVSKGVDPQSANKRRREDKLVPLKSFSRGIPSHVSAAISRAMRIAPVERTQSATELVLSIERPQKKASGMTSVQKIIILSVSITILCFALVALAFMSSINNFQDEPFVPSSETPTVIEPQELLAPYLLGSDYVDVQNDPNYLGKFHFPITEKFDSNFKKGEIMEQTPLPGQPVGEDGVIRLVVSIGAKTALMPDLKGLTHDEAVSILTALEIKYTVANIVNDGSLITGTVVYANYEVGDILVEGESEVILYIAKEPSETQQ